MRYKGGWIDFLGRPLSLAHCAGLERMGTSTRKQSYLAAAANARSLVYNLKKKKKTLKIPFLLSPPLSSEMREKLKILGNEIELLREESSQKDLLLSKNRHEHTGSRAERDALRNELNVCAQDFKQRQSEVGILLILFIRPAEEIDDRMRILDDFLRESYAVLGGVFLLSCLFALHFSRM